MSDENQTSAAASLGRLLSMMTRLRDPQTGCPWDAEQTMQTLTRYTLEEAYETVDAIERGNIDEIKDELGDLLFQIVFYAQIGSELQQFNFADIADAISNKIERRHPHVFANVSRNTDLSAQWEAIKATEKSSRPGDSLLSDIPSGLPALMYAQKIQKRCATVGFDWPDINPVIAKVEEELNEVQAELNDEINTERVEEEIGDLLFAVVNLSRHANIDADTALRRASKKFAARFQHVEQAAEDGNLSLKSLSLSELEAMWQEAKQAV